MTATCWSGTSLIWICPQGGLKAPKSLEMRFWFQAEKMKMKTYFYQEIVLSYQGEEK